MNPADLHKLTEDNFNNLVALFDSGANDEVKAVLAAMSRFHEYSFGNVQMIIRQRPDATRVAGFRTWQKMDRFVKKGEKGILIQVPMIWKPKEQPAGEDKTVLRFKGGYVFDLAQTDGAPLPQLHSDEIKGDPDALLERLRENITASGIKLSYVENLAGAEGVSKGGAIAIKEGHDRPKDFAVLCHEYGHELLHRDANRHTLTRDQKELEAEAVAYVVSSAIGLDMGNSSANYIAIYKGDKAALKASMDRIQKTSQHILKGLGFGREYESDETRNGQREVVRATIPTDSDAARKPTAEKHHVP